MRVHNLIFLLSEFPDDMHVMLPDGCEPRLVETNVRFGTDPEDQMDVLIIDRNDGNVSDEGIEGPASSAGSSSAERE